MPHKQTDSNIIETRPAGAIFPAALLLDWYDKHRRDLPWREDPTPYHVWLSEIMLQQTRVEAVRGYYRRFLDALPDIQSLAASPEPQYLKLWEGLGYYSRVRNLHKAACHLVEHYGGRLPEDYKALLQLPGIGPYTAAAISSIAFGKPEPAVDGNLLRIFARLTLYEESILTPAATRAAREYFLQSMDRARPGAFNQALMDLGAMVCLPNSAPLCGQCPLQAHCLAHRQGREEDLPFRPAKRKRQIEKMTIFLIHHNDKIILHKRPATGLLAGLYEFPNAPGWLTKNEALSQVESLGLEPLRIQKLPAAKHIFTHMEWHMHGYRVFTGDWTQKGSTPEEAGLFLASPQEILDHWSIPSAFRVYTDLATGKG